jgi:carboxylate-amine ligase
MPLNTDWKASAPLTVGLEWELSIADRESLKPKNAFDRITEALPAEFLPFVHAEIYKSMLEIVSPPSDSEEQIFNLFGKVFDALKPIAERENFHLVGLGTLFIPAEGKPEKNLTPRYKDFCNQFRVLLDDFYIYGIHIHIGFPSEEWALKAHNALLFYAPFLLALSAASPFYKGENTGIHSFRTVIFERLPRAELPPFYENYGQFEENINTLHSLGVIELIKDLWHHIRIRPDLGTVEVRVFDSLANTDRVKALVKLVRAIAALARDWEAPAIPRVLMTENWWQAKRYSLDADFFTPEGRKALKQVGFDLIYELEDRGILNELGYGKEEFLMVLRKPSPARDILARAKALKDLKRVVKVFGVLL